MRWDSIGSVDTGQLPSDESWILWAMEIALNYISFVCGDPPSGCRLDIFWSEHELGSYPSLGVSYEETPGQEVFRYINKCEEALGILNESVDWYSLKEHAESEWFAENDESE